MPRAGLNAARVVAAAAEMSNDVGLSQLTLAALATRLGVRQPSLYKHVESIDALRNQVTVQAKIDLADRLAQASVGRARDDALFAIAHEYRAWSLQHPGLYQAAQRSAVPGDDADVAVTERGVATVAAVMAGYGIGGDDAIDAVRAFRATVHGFVSLEIGGGLTYPQNLDRSFDRLLRALAAALADWSHTSRPGD